MVHIASLHAYFPIFPCYSMLVCGGNAKSSTPFACLYCFVNSINVGNGGSPRTKHAYILFSGACYACLHSHKCWAAQGGSTWASIRHGGERISTSCRPEWKQIERIWIYSTVQLQELKSGHQGETRARPRRTLALSIEPHCSEFGRSSTRIPLGVIE